MRLQLCQPRHELVVIPPRTFAAGLGRDEFFRRLKCFTFHFQIDLDIAVGRLDGSVPQPGADHVQIDIGLEQMHRRGVAPGVGSYLAGEQRGTRTGSLGNSMRNNVSQAETGDPITLGVDEKGNGFRNGARSGSHCRWF